MLDHCKHVTIPFVGGAAILPHLKAKAIVANDKHLLAINFYRVVSGCHGIEEKEDLIFRCKRTLSHPNELEAAKLLVEVLETPGNAQTRVALAWAFWAICWIGRKGMGGTPAYNAAKPSIRWRANGGTNGTRVRAAADDLEAWSECFQRCQWVCCDYSTILHRVVDIHQNGVYCDPPWVTAGTRYEHSFTENDHMDLRDILASRFHSATIVLRYDDHPLIWDLYKDNWYIIEAASRTQSNSVKGELWITNKG